MQWETIVGFGQGSDMIWLALLKDHSTCYVENRLKTGQERKKGYWSRQEMMVGKMRDDGGDEKTAESEYFSKRELRGLLKHWDGSTREREESGVTPLWGLNN